ncbi:MAG TPA: hypothetical protein DG753_03210 [Clostridium sp.]|nr:hypothetical protein [Clostridium sp.]
MSLTLEQKKNTIKELKQNLEISELPLSQIANDLGTDEMLKDEPMNKEYRK